MSFAGQRIKGQEVEILLIADGSALDTITSIKSFDLTYQLEILKEGYLGETTDRRDAIFKGIAGKFEMHINGKAAFEFIKSVVDKARRRLPGFKVNIKVTLNFPDGTRVRIIVPDCEFGEFPVSAGGRGEYVNVSVTYEASEANTITT